jgi:hypothetical protein
MARDFWPEGFESPRVPARSIVDWRSLQSSRVVPSRRDMLETLEAAGVSQGRRKCVESQVARQAVPAILEPDNSDFGHSRSLGDTSSGWTRISIPPVNRAIPAGGVTSPPQFAPIEIVVAPVLFLVRVGGSREGFTDKTRAVQDDCEVHLDRSMRLSTSNSGRRARATSSSPRVSLETHRELHLSDSDVRIL